MVHIYAVIINYNCNQTISPSSPERSENDSAGSDLAEDGTNYIKLPALSQPDFTQIIWSFSINFSHRL